MADREVQGVRLDQLAQTRRDRSQIILPAGHKRVVRKVMHTDVQLVAADPLVEVVDGQLT